MPDGNLNNSNSFNQTEKIQVDTQKNILDSKMNLHDSKNQNKALISNKKVQNLSKGIGAKDETRRQLSLQEKLNNNNYFK